ncbi:MAG TPA: hypothetical protein VGM30_24155 [Puia sp.]|jgi:hypothetical protein
MAKKNSTTDKNTIDLPEVKDIPGQENVRPPRLGELADTTASSSDEEGDDVLEPGDDDLDIVMGNDADVSPSERSTLRNIDRRVADSEDLRIKNASLDSTDGDGTPLNESSLDQDEAGDDLDVPGSEDDDIDEASGDEDEENNDYSISDNNDDDEVDREN